MSTTTDYALAEAIKRGYRTLREDIHTVMTAEGTARLSLEVSESHARIAAVLPIMEALTGRDSSAIKSSVLKRLRNDGRL